MFNTNEKDKFIVDSLDKIDKYNTIHKKTVELLLIYIKIKLSIDFFNESG